MKTKPVIGIALDLNLESVSGSRIDDLIKRSIRNLYSELKQDFIFYLHNPKSDLHDLESNEINENYFSAELNDFSLPCPFKFQTVLNDLLARVTNHCDGPVLVIITNRYFEEQKYHYEISPQCILRNVATLRHLRDRHGHGAFTSFCSCFDNTRTSNRISLETARAVSKCSAP